MSATTESDHRARPPLTVAFDGGPMLGSITGIGAAVTETAAALRDVAGLTLRPYTLSFRGDLLPGMTRLPLPALVAQRLWSRADVPRLDRWLRPAQVVHGTNYVVPPSRLPRLVTVYDCWFLRHPDLAAPDVARAGAVLRRAVHGGAMVHASSHATAEAVREILRTDRVEVVHLAALPAPARNDPPHVETDIGTRLAGAPFVLSIGTLERRKNIPALVAAFGEIAPDIPELRLVLAGSDGDDVLAIDAAIARLPLPIRDHVLRTGRIDDDTKHRLLTNALLLAYPSLDEGFGFPLLEAMQCDLPVIAATRGSIPEVAGDAAVLVDPDDIPALADALRRVIEDDDLRARLITAGRARLDAFSWADTARQLTGLYHRLVEEGR